MFNQLKTVFLLGILTALLLFIGSFFGQQGLTIAIFFVLVMNFGSYFFSHKIVLSMYRARPASKSQYTKLHSMVSSLSKKVGIPKPKVFIIPSDNLNAFATGRNPKNAVIAFTSGILRALNDKELEGVAAHELAHVKNRDILISTVVACVAGVISYLSMMARWAAIFGGFGGRDNNNSNVLEFLFLAILAPLLAVLIQLAISRSREFEADASGSKFLGNSKGLASALKKLHSHKRPMKFANPSTAHLFIVNPLSAKGLSGLFSTHPSLEDRLERLRSMKF